MIWINNSINDVFDLQFEYNDEFSQSKQDDIYTTSTNFSSFTLIQIFITGVEEILYLCNQYKQYICNETENNTDRLVFIIITIVIITIVIILEYNIYFYFLLL